jgi:hypothetical protein
VCLGAFAPRPSQWTDDDEDDAGDEIPFMNLLAQGDNLNANHSHQPLNGMREEHRSGLSSKSSGSTSNKSCCSNGDTTNDDYVVIQLVCFFVNL